MKFDTNVRSGPLGFQNRVGSKLAQKRRIQEPLSEDELLGAKISGNRFKLQQVSPHDSLMARTYTIDSIFIVPDAIHAVCKR